MPRDDANSRDLPITRSEEGRRLDVFLASTLSGISRSQIQKGIDAGLILLNGNPARKNVRLRAGDLLTVKERPLHDMAHPALEAEDLPLDVIYEDEYLLVVNKPPGLVVHPGSGNKRGTLVNALMHHTGSLAQGFGPDRPGIVHRIDKDTSGVLIAAKTNAAHALLADLFARRRIEKYYLGVCLGIAPRERGTIDLPVGRSRVQPIKQAVRQGGRLALTEYRVVEQRSSVSLIVFRLHTGRTHQIRVHSSHAGFPIAGDVLYGGGRGRLLQLPVMDRGFASSVLACFERQALHAFCLVFRHPFTAATVRITAPLPMDFRAALRLMEVGVDDERLKCGGE